MLMGISQTTENNKSFFAKHFFIVLFVSLFLFSLVPEIVQAQVGPGYGPLCKQPRLKEKFDCPEVECDANVPLKGALTGSNQFKERVKAYFEYEPPADNREVYLDQDYEINKAGETTRPPASSMDPDSNGCSSFLTKLTGLGVVDGDISEPCQDNRWRDMCLIGNMVADNDYQFYERELMKDEEPLSGMLGSKPLYSKSSSKLNCMVPKNTERKSPLNFDNGWRYRDMCPGNQKLRRVERDKYEDTVDIFRGEYGCLAPLPKCDLKSDWQFDSIQWKNQEYSRYVTIFGNTITGGINTLLGGADLHTKLQNILSSSQFQSVKNLMKPKESPAAECKPAFWVRFMLDSCANQYILQKSMNPDYIYNPDKNDFGRSPRFCQPFKTVPITFGEEEYKVSDYLKRSYRGLLRDDYMPWIKYDRHQEYNNIGNGLKWSINPNSFGQDSRDYRNNNWPDRKIKWKNNTKVELNKGYLDINGTLKINDYAAHPVERIVDPLHPFSPRYDIAEDIDGTQLIDRTLFGDITESEAHITWAKAPLKVEGLKKYWCVPNESEQNGYWEFDCTIYCSAVEVDLLRFRYKDYRLCMGCQIDTNERAFWDEWEESRKYYRSEYCWTMQNKDECEYGDEICATCTKMVIYDALCAASCILGCSDELCDKALEFTEGCTKCGQGARAEALARTRSQSNDGPLDDDRLDDWSPTAVGSSKWPVCSTRFDHKGDTGLCKDAKEEFGCDNQGNLAESDPNIAKESTSAAEKCEKKTINQICGDVAKPVYSVNFLKIRTRKGDFRTDDTTPTFNLAQIGTGNNAGAFTGGDFDEQVENWKQNYADEDPAPGNGFREYFGNRRPYMRWWDTGKEAFQVKSKPDYWCDWGANDAIMGVGRDYNSIHGRKAQLCRYGGGGGIGDSCFEVQDWKNGTNIPNGRKFPSLSGSEWAELKMYQANCFRKDGLNCLCQYEKTFKDGGGEDKVLSMMGASISVPRVTAEATANNDKKMATKQVYWPLSWRGYVSTPANLDNSTTGPVIGNNQQFPNLYGNLDAGSMISGGLDSAIEGDVVMWPANGGVMPHVAIVEATNNINDYGSLSKVPNGSRWVRISDANNGKYLDACGNTSYLGHGPSRTLYPNKDELPSSLKTLIGEQVAATYYCDDPELGHCVERNWGNVAIWRPYKDNVREVQ